MFELILAAIGGAIAYALGQKVIKQRQPPTQTKTRQSLAGLSGGVIRDAFVQSEINISGEAVPRLVTQLEEEIARVAFPSLAAHF